MLLLTIIFLGLFNVGFSTASYKEKSERTAIDYFLTFCALIGLVGFLVSLTIP